MQNDKIILYSTGCPKCKVLKSKLDSKNLDYEVFSDVDKMIEMGMSEMPMLSVNGDLMNFGNAIKWINSRE